MSIYCMILNDYDQIWVMFLPYWGNISPTQLLCLPSASVMAVHRPEFKGCIFYTIIFPYLDIQTNYWFAFLLILPKKYCHFKSAPQKLDKIGNASIWNIEFHIITFIVMEQGVSSCQPLLAIEDYSVKIVFISDF